LTSGNVRRPVGSVCGAAKSGALAPPCSWSFCAARSTVARRGWPRVQASAILPRKAVGAGMGEQARMQGGERHAGQDASPPQFPQIEHFRAKQIPVRVKKTR